MRVLLVHNRYRSSEPSGENRVVDAEAELLSLAGHDVEVWGPESDEIAERSLVGRALVPAEVVWSLPSARRLHELLAKWRPDVVHVHNTFPLVSASVLRTCRRAGVPVVATLHNYRLLCAGGSFFRDGAVCHDCVGTRHLSGVRHGCYRESRLATAPVALANVLHGRRWRNVDLLLTLSSAQRELFVAAGYPAERVRVKPNFVAEGQRRDVGRPGGHFLYLGRLAATKGIPVLMEAWERYEEGGGRTTLKIAGAGPLEDELAAWASGRAVELLGHLPAAACAELVRSARAVVLPSVWEETFGLVVIEAMAAGVPTVATAHASFLDLVDDGRSGLLVPPADPDGLAGALGRLARDDELSVRLGEAARQRYLAEYTPERNLELLEDAYLTVTAQPRPPEG